MTLRECITQEMESPRKLHGSIVVYRVKDSSRHKTTNYTCCEWARDENRPPVAELYRESCFMSWAVSRYRNPTKTEKAIIDSFNINP